MQYNNSHFKKLLTEPINALIDAIIESVQILSPIKNDSYRRNVKYTIRDYVIGIIDVLKNCESWNNYNGHIPSDTLRKKHNEWCKFGVYEHVYEKSLGKFLKTTKKTEELKFQSIDSIFIEDVNGCKDSGYSGIYKRRKGEASRGIKITSIDTTNGIPISIDIDAANNYDSPLLPKAIENRVIECNTKKYQNHNRYKQYLLADPGYDSKKNHKFLIKKGYNVLIKQNKRRIKNKKLIRKMNKKQEKIYKKRMIIENYHSWLKKFNKIKRLYERNIESYRGLLLLAISVIINRRIVQNKR